MNKFHQQRRYKRSSRRFGTVNKQALLSQAHRLHDKYLKDAQAASESYSREYYMQYADHYYRVIKSLQEEDIVESEEELHTDQDLESLDHEKDLEKHIEKIDIQQNTSNHNKQDLLEKELSNFNTQEKESNHES